MQVKIIKMEANVETPVYATDGAACFDIFGYKVHSVGESSTTFHTGLKFEVPANHVLLIYSRSGHGFNKDTRLANCVGVIDSDYRGELLVKLRCDDACEDTVDVKAGDRIAQGMVVPVERVQFEIVDELGSTERGENGFGSTN
jgi:dUTP pyrophosphatase